VWGEEDGWLDPSQAKILAEKITNAEMRLVPNAGHFVMEDAQGRGRGGPGGLFLRG
jgi:pimeloyl-ACP methyl ester carboxylesterase